MAKKLPDGVFAKRLFEFKLRMQRAAKEIGKPLGKTDAQVLKSDPRYATFGKQIEAGQAQRGPRTPKQKAALKKAQAASAKARRKSKNK
jgi:hypothetical protein